MTTKQIAEYTGKPFRTVQDWAKAVGAKSASMGAKLASSTSTHPADWDLAETCLIIEEGMGADVANVYRTNAVNTEMAAKAQGPSVQLSGSFVRELRLTMGAENATRLLFKVVGLDEAPKAITGAETSKAPLRLGLPAPKPYKPIAFPARGTMVRDVYIIAEMIGKDSGWIERTSRDLDITIGSWDRADCVNLYLKSRKRSQLHNPSPAEIDAEVEKIEKWRRKGIE